MPKGKRKVNFSVNIVFLFFPPIAEVKDTFSST